MKVILALLPIFFLSANGHYFGSEKFFNMYLRYRFTFNCIGYQNMKTETLKFYDAIKECLPEVHSDGSSSNSINQFMKPETNTTNIMYPEEVVRFIKNEGVSRIKIYTCAYRKLKVLDDKDNLMYDQVVDGIKKFKLNKKLQKDILTGLQNCKKMSELMPNLPSGLSPNLKRFMAFMLCKEQEVMISCLRNDLRYSKSEYDLAGLDGLFPDLSDEDKIMEIVWSNLQMNTMTKPEEIFI